MTNLVTSAEQDFDAVVDKVLDHFKSLISFAGAQRDRLDTVASNVDALGQKVETDIMAKLDSIEEKIREAVLQTVMDKIAAVEADLGARISALTAPGGTSATTGSGAAAPVAQATTDAGVTMPAT